MYVCVCVCIQTVYVYLYTHKKSPDNDWENLGQAVNSDFLWGLGLGSGEIVCVCVAVLIREILLFMLYPAVLFELFISTCCFHEKIMLIHILCRKLLEKWTTVISAWYGNCEAAKYVLFFQSFPDDPGLVFLRPASFVTLEENHTLLGADTASRDDLGQAPAFRWLNYLSNPGQIITYQENINNLLWEILIRCIQWLFSFSISSLSAEIKMNFWKHLWSVMKLLSHALSRWTSQ